MKFVANKPPVVQNSQRTYKRSLNLHFAIIAVSIAAVIIKFITTAQEGTTSVENGLKVLLMLVIGALFSVFIEVAYSYFEGTLEKFKVYGAYIEPISIGLLIALLLPTITPI